MGYDVVDIEPVGEADDTDDPDVDVDDVAGVDDVRGPADAIVDELTARDGAGGRGRGLGGCRSGAGPLGRDQQIPRVAVRRAGGHCRVRKA